jgi:hypothetical protein
MSTPTPPKPTPTPVPVATAPAPAPPPAPPAPVPGVLATDASAVQADIKADVTAVTGALTNVAAQARLEYEALHPAAQAKVHQLLNDLEAMGRDGKAIVLAGMHSLFGEKPPSVSATGMQPTAPSATVIAAKK